MTSALFLLKHDFKHLNVSSQVDDSDNSSINHAFTAVALEVVELLQHLYPNQAEVISSTKTMDCDRSETVTIRAIELEYSQIIEIEPLTERELEVLRLIVDGYSNSLIGEKLYISTGTVKTHVRNILKKLCAGDRYSPINHLQNITPKVVKPKSCFLDFDLFSDRTQAVIIAVKRGIVNL